MTRLRADHLVLSAIAPVGLLVTLVAIPALAAVALPSSRVARRRERLARTPSDQHGADA